MALDLKNNRVEFAGVGSNILRWEVWFMTPVGLFQTVETAVERVESLDMDPRLLVIPVPVAIGPDGLYEVYARS